MIPALSFADSALFRVDNSTLADQTLMEILIGDLPESVRRRFTDSNGDYLDACKWEGVQCDDDQNVTKIDFHLVSLGGSISFDHLPPHLKDLNIDALFNHDQKWEMVLYGTLDAAALPRTMISLSVISNNFSSTIDFVRFPPTMTDLRLALNEFSGTVQLTALPASLAVLRLDSNNFEGTLDFSALPPDLSYCSLESNHFTGTVDLTSLPEKLADLDLKGNQLEGTVDLSKIPKAMRLLNLRKNYFAPIPKDKRRRWLKHGQTLKKSE